MMAFEEIATETNEENDEDHLIKILQKPFLPNDSVQFLDIPDKKDFNLQFDLSQEISREEQHFHSEINTRKNSARKSKNSPKVEKRILKPKLVKLEVDSHFKKRHMTLE
jgi:hypothetical protein